MEKEYGSLATEQLNPRSLHIDKCDTVGILRILNEEDHLVPDAVEKEIQNIALAVDGIYARLKTGGRLFYIGAGTSGRLGVVDASECPPTFGTDPCMIQGIIAGGDTAIRNAVEGAEDDETAGEQIIDKLHITAHDAVVGIAASGGTPYVVGALRRAGEKGAFTVSLTNSPGCALNNICEVSITPLVGPEVVTGSTRLKAGTSQKLVLNMISTAVMILMGKVYGNLMVDLQASNHKLQDRAERIVMQAVGVDRLTASKAIEKSDGNVKIAIMMLMCGIDCEHARQMLNGCDGIIMRALEEFNQNASGKDVRLQ